MIKIFLVDDHQLFRAGLKQILNETNDISVIGEAATGEEAINLVKKLKPDLVVMDISMPGMGGLEATKTLVARYPGIRILILTVHPTENYAFRVLRAGAMGYINKTVAPEELISAIRTIHQGERYLGAGEGNKIVFRLLSKKNNFASVEALTDRELEILCLLAKGLEVKQIADELSITTKTVETHRANLLRKLNLSNIAELTRFAIREGLIEA